jgi:LPXTG-motif cell wall-anchored protein
MKRILEDMKVEGSVDTTQVGVYEVTYKYSKILTKKLKVSRAIKRVVPEKGVAVAVIKVVESSNGGEKTPPAADETNNTNVSGANPTESISSISTTKTSGNINSSNNSKISAAAATKRPTLPKTGEKVEVAAMALGGFLLLAAVGIVVFRKKKK